LSLPEGWEIVDYKKSFVQLSTTHKKVKTKECNDSGKFPVVDQGQEAICGYLDDKEKLIELDKPVIIFGDHTRVIKWIDYNFIPGADGTKILKPKDIFFPRFFYYQMRNINLPDKGYSRHFKFLKEVDFLLPPLTEQKQIAQKLDKLLARVEKIKSMLDNAPARIKRFRQSVLASAVGGEFSNQNIKWEKLTLNDVAKVATGKTPLKSEKSFYENGTIPWLTSSVTGESYVTKTNSYVTQKAVDDCKLKLFKAGTLLVAMYGEGKTRGQVTELTFDATINQACAAIIVDENKIEKAYLKIRLLENYAAIRQLAEGGNQPNLNLSKVRSISILVPSRKEQIKIVKKVETLFAIADKMEANLANAQKRVDNLTQSILAKAFRGELL